MPIKKNPTSCENLLYWTSAGGHACCSHRIEATASVGMSIPILAKQNAFQMGPRFCKINFKKYNYGIDDSIWLTLWKIAILVLHT